MRTQRLSALLVAALLIGGPATTAFAEPATTSQELPAPSAGSADPAPPAAAPATSTDAERYAAREAKDAKAAEFHGGGHASLYIGGSTVTIVLLVVLLVILL